MLKNYITVAWRNLRRQPGYSLINIAGLALGLACSLLICLWVQDELSFDGFHEHAGSIYRVLYEYPDDSGRRVTGATVPSPLAQAAKAEIPEVMEAVRWQPWGEKKELIKFGEKAFFEEGIASYDPAFLAMFSFPLVKGNLQEAMADRNFIVVTEACARKYFGGQEPINKVLNWNNWQMYTVKAVVQDPPENSHMQFNLLTTFHNEEGGWPQGFTWTAFNRPIYLRLRENANVEEVNHKLTGLLHQNNESARQSSARLFLQPLRDIHLTAGLAGEYARVREVKYVYIYSFIALFVLLIACINFVNLSTARSLNRAKEVGMRKTLGAHRLQVFIQYLSESFVLICFSQMLALILVELFLPKFNALSGKHLMVNFLDFKILLASGAIILLAGILAGGYPAIYLSGFNPVHVLKGSVPGGLSKIVLRKALVVTQFSLSIILILGTLIVSRQLHFMRSKKLGFVKENVVYVPIKDNVGRNYEAFKQRLLQQPNILSVAVKDILPTATLGQTRLTRPGQDSEQGVVADRIGVGYDYFETLNLELAAGRSFSPLHPTDATEAVIINAEAARQLELQEPVGEKIHALGQDRVIVGVVKDAHFRSLHHSIGPEAYHVLTNLTTNAANLYGLILVKINGENPAVALAGITKAWNEFNAAFPLEISFLDEKYDRLYKSEQQISTIVNWFTFLALAISCLGLFGLASFMTEQRTKEIGVRKVLGASVAGLVFMLSQSFTKWVIISNIVAWPIAWFVMQRWLQDFAYRIEIGWWVFALAGGMALAIALLTVSTQAIKAALANPVEALRYE